MPSPALCTNFEIPSSKPLAFPPHPVLPSVEQIGDFFNPNPVQNFLSVIPSDPNPVDLLKYLIQSGLYPKKTLIKYFTAVINAVWISISDPVKIFSKSSPTRIRF